MPSEQKFSKPPSGTELSSDDMKKIVAGENGEKPAPQIEDVAKALGGTVQQETKEVESAPPTVDLPKVDGEEVSKEDRREYIRSLLADEPFSKTYKLFDGNLVVTFKSRTTQENDQVDIDVKSPGYGELVRAKSFAIVRERLRIAASTAKVVVGSDAAVDTDTEKHIVWAFYDELDEPAFAAIRHAFRQFEGICDVMFEKANDSNFWKGTGGTT